jgi:hypothetical protein
VNDLETGHGLSRKPPRLASGGCCTPTVNSRCRRASSGRNPHLQDLSNSANDELSQQPPRCSTSRDLQTHQFPGNYKQPILTPQCVQTRSGCNDFQLHNLQLFNQVQSYCEDKPAENIFFEQVLNSLQIMKVNIVDCP